MLKMLVPLVSLLTLFVPVSAHAQQSPEEVAHASVDAVRSNGMSAITDFIHPEELQRFKQMLLPVFTETDATTSQNLIRAFFGQSTTIDAVEAMDPASFMRGFMSATEGLMQGMSITIGDSQILGSVSEGDTVHLVTRSTVATGPIQLTQLEVVSLKPYQDTWRLLLSGKFEGMAQALKAKSAPSE